MFTIFILLLVALLVKENYTDVIEYPDLLLVIAMAIDLIIILTVYTTKSMGETDK